MRQSGISGGRHTVEYDGHVYSLRDLDGERWTLVCDGVEAGHVSGAELRSRSFEEDGIRYLTDAYERRDVTIPPHSLAELAAVVDPDHSYAPGGDSHRRLKLLRSLLGLIIKYEERAVRAFEPGDYQEARRRVGQLYDETRRQLGLEEDQVRLAVELARNDVPVRSVWDATQTVLSGD